MRVFVLEDAVKAALASEAVVDLNRLLIHTSTERHAIIFETPNAFDLCLSLIASAHQYIYRNKWSSRIATTFPSDVATVTIAPVMQSTWSDPASTLTLTDAVAVLDEPLGVLVENSANDWAFLRQIMRLNDRVRVDRFVTAGWLEPLHGGGQTLLAQLKARLAAPKTGLRTFVLFDSDRLHPEEWNPSWNGERPSGGQATCSAFEWEKYTTQHLPLRYWVLKRRFIESYLSDIELEKTPSKASVDEFYTLPSYARWFYNMKDGFEGDSKRSDKDRSRSLYSFISAHTLTALAKGFGGKVANHYSNSVHQLDWDEDARAEADQMLPRLLRLL